MYLCTVVLCPIKLLRTNIVIQPVQVPIEVTKYTVANSGTITAIRISPFHMTTPSSHIYIGIYHHIQSILSLLSNYFLSRIIINLQMTDDNYIIIHEYGNH